MAALLKTLCHFSLSPICETEITLTSDPASPTGARECASWTKPQLGTTEKGQRWSDLMTIVTWQLWLAREIIEDNPLPWATASTKREINPGTGCPELLWTFSRDRDTVGEFKITSLGDQAKPGTA